MNEEEAKKKIAEVLKASKKDLNELLREIAQKE